MGRTYRHYSIEFKIALVERYLGGGGSIRRLAFDAGIDRSLLYFWLRKYGMVILRRIRHSTASPELVPLGCFARCNPLRHSCLGRKFSCTTL